MTATYLAISWLMFFFAGFQQQTQCNSISSKNLQTTNFPATTSPKLITNQSFADDETVFEDWSANQTETEQFWLNRRDLFFNATSFNVTKVSIYKYLEFLIVFFYLTFQQCTPIGCC